MGSGSSAVKDKTTIRCPKCDWVSVTKVIDATHYIGLCMEPMGDHFLCTNPKCGVERIYGENGVFFTKGFQKEEA